MDLSLAQRLRRIDPHRPWLSLNASDEFNIRELYGSPAGTHSTSLGSWEIYQRINYVVPTFEGEAPCISDFLAMYRKGKQDKISSIVRGTLQELPPFEDPVHPEVIQTLDEITNRVLEKGKLLGFMTRVRDNYTSQVSNTMFGAWLGFFAETIFSGVNIQNNTGIGIAVGTILGYLVPMTCRKISEKSDKNIHYENIPLVQEIGGDALKSMEREYALLWPEKEIIGQYNRLKNAGWVNTIDEYHELIGLIDYVVEE